MSRRDHRIERKGLIGYGHLRRMPLERWPRMLHECVPPQGRKKVGLEKYECSTSLLDENVLTDYAGGEEPEDVIRRIR